MILIHICVISRKLYIDKYTNVCLYTLTFSLFILSRRFNTDHQFYFWYEHGTKEQVHHIVNKICI